LEHEVPFEKGEANAAHVPRLSKEEVEMLSNDEVDAVIRGTPLEGVGFPKSLSVEQLYVSKRLVLMHRDVFAT
jgi:hypothetical protein